MADETPKPNGTPEPPKIRIKPGEPLKKSDTSRIDIKSAHAAPPAAPKPGELREPSKESVADFYKKSTIRIDGQPPKVSDTQKIKTETSRMPVDASKNTTMRVDVIQPDAAKKKSETSRIELPTGEAAKRATARIPEAPVAEAPKKPIPMGVPTAPAIPPQRPKTISIPRPQAPIAAKPPAPAVDSEPMTAPALEAVSEAKKSETARIDLPHDTGDGDRPATRPKTIRIKRPDGTTAKKALTIARPSEDQVYKPITPSDVSLGSDEGPGTAFTVMTLVATLVCFVLLYVLAAQTILPTLPWPGRV